MGAALAGFKVLKPLRPLAAIRELGGVLAPHTVAIVGAEAMDQAIVRLRGPLKRYPARPRWKAC